MRVYLPATDVIARELVDSGELALPATGYLTGFAVTPALVAHYGETDADAELEELEYAAMTAAARGSLRLIDIDPQAWRRRFVFAADLPADRVSIRDDLDLGVVRLDGPVTLAQIVSAHVDDSEVAHVVAAAAAAILPADLGDEAAGELVDDAEGSELSWYATQELSALLDLD